MPDPSGQFGNKLTTSFAAPPRKNGPSDNLNQPNRTQGSNGNGGKKQTAGGYSGIPQVVYVVPPQYTPAPQGSGGYSGIPYSPPTGSQGTRANDGAAGGFNTPQGRDESSAISDAFQAATNPHDRLNPKTFSFGGNRDQNQNTAAKAAITKMLDRVAGMSGATPAPRYDAPKLYSDRVPQDQAVEGYEPYTGPSYEVPNYPSWPNYEQERMMMAANQANGIVGAPQPRGNNIFSPEGRQAFNNIPEQPRQTQTSQGGGLLGPQFGPETMPDPVDDGDGSYTPAVAGRPDVYQPTESPMFKRGMAAVDNVVDRFKKPMQTLDDYLGNKFPGMYNADKGNPNAGQRDEYRANNEDIQSKPLTKSERSSFENLSSKDKLRVQKFMRNGKTFAEAMKLAGLGKKTTTAAAPTPSPSPYNTQGAMYPKYTQTWAGLPTGRI